MPRRKDFGATPSIDFVRVAVRRADDKWKLICYEFIRQAALDRREHLRFGLRVPVTYSWRCDESEIYGTGFSGNISTHGIFVLCNEPPPEKTAVQLEVSLLSEDIPGSGVYLRAAGQIVRTIGEGSAVGFAARAKFILSKTPASTTRLSPDIKKKVQIDSQWWAKYSYCAKSCT